MLSSTLGEQIELTEEEQDAVTAATLVFDPKPADQELTEKGTVGEVRLVIWYSC